MISNAMVRPCPNAALVILVLIKAQQPTNTNNVTPTISANIGLHIRSYDPLSETVESFLLIRYSVSDIITDVSPSACIYVINTKREKFIFYRHMTSLSFPSWDIYYNKNYYVHVCSKFHTVYTLNTWLTVKKINPLFLPQYIDISNVLYYLLVQT